VIEGNPSLPVCNAWITTLLAHTTIRTTATRCRARGSDAKFTGEAQYVQPHMSGRLYNSLREGHGLSIVQPQQCVRLQVLRSHQHEGLPLRCSPRLQQRPRQWVAQAGVAGVNHHFDTRQLRQVPAAATAAQSSKTGHVLTLYQCQGTSKRRTPSPPCSTAAAA
jgi:hypothetical protein